MQLAAEPQDIVIPSHFAVASQFNEKSISSPRVVLTYIREQSAYSKQFTAQLSELSGHVIVRSLVIFALNQGENTDIFTDDAKLKSHELSI